MYALSARDGAVIWKRTFPTTATDACGTYGFSSTGAIDLNRGVLYEAAADGSVHPLDLERGEERAPWPLRLLARPFYEYVWGGLRLIDGRLYVSVASYCDEPDARGVAAEGGLVAVDPDTAAVESTFDTVPGFGNLGGIWGWGGVADFALSDATAAFVGAPSYDAARGTFFVSATGAQTISPLIEVDGEVFGGDLDGNLYAFRAPARPSRLRPR